MHRFFTVITVLASCTLSSGCASKRVPAQDVVAGIDHCPAELRKVMIEVRGAAPQVAANVLCAPSFQPLLP